MLDDVFHRLADPDFQDLGAGLMSFPAYVYTEYDDAAAVARETDLPARELLRRAEAAVSDRLDGTD